MEEERREFEGVYTRGNRRAYNGITTIRSLKYLQGGWWIQFGCDVSSFAD
jgi:hypothetical protein